MSAVEPPNWSHTQSKSAAMSRLIWRDTQMIQTLVIAGVAGTIAFNLISIMIWFFFGGQADSVMGICGAWLVVVPCFVAFGAPAMLVGTEEESGTLSWIRTLPVSWQQFAASKVWVAVGGVLINWFVALLVAVFIGLVAANREMIGELGELPWTAFVMIPLGCVGISMLLLLLGFTMAYLVRSSLLGILCSGALFILCMIGLNLVSYGLHSSFHHLSDTQGGWIVSIISMLFLVGLWAIQRRLARRRLLSPDPEFAAKFKSAISSKEVYPQASPRIPSGKRPSQVASLLWQQTRQMGLACALILVAALFCSLPFLLYSETQIDRGDSASLQFSHAWRQCFQSWLVAGSEC